MKLGRMQGGQDVLSDQKHPAGLDPSYELAVYPAVNPPPGHFGNNLLTVSAEIMPEYATASPRPLNQ